MKNVIIVMIALPVLLGSCEKQKEPDYSYKTDEYIKSGMPDPSKTWNNQDFFHAISTLDKIKAKDSLALPRYNSKKSGTLFQHLISEDNLSFLNSDTISLQEKAFRIQAFLGIQSDLSRIYTDIYSREQYYKKELIQIYLFGIRITQKMLDLAYKINASDDVNDRSLKSAFPTIQYAYLTMMSYVLGNQKNTSIFDEGDLEALSDSVYISLEKNMPWFDEMGKKMLKQELQSVIDSTSSIKIKNEYADLIHRL